MRLRRYLDGDLPRLGVESDGGLVPLPPAPNSLVDLMHDEAALREARALATRPAGPPHSSLAGVTTLAPIERPAKIVAIGRNYREHIDEEGADAPPEPLIFAKFPSSVIGPDVDISWSERLTSQVDYEAELGVIIGRLARNVTPTNATDFIFGYTCLNDVSARDLQFSDGQWVRGKSLDTFTPMGPSVVTVDEVPDPQDLSIRCLVNGEVMQEASTAQMHFTVAELVAYCSSYFTLEPGDVIATGTPGGVGVFRTPPRFLRDGDEVVVEIDHVGKLRNRCSSFA